jgi:galactonate dehydratase
MAKVLMRELAPYKLMFIEEPVLSDHLEAIPELAGISPAPIALAANLQIDAVCHNAFIQEQSLGIHYNAGNDLLDYITDRSVFAYENGFVTIPNGPGLGITVNEEYVTERAAVGHRWRNPIWRHADNSVAEW